MKTFTRLAFVAVLFSGIQAYAVQEYIFQVSTKSNYWFDGRSTYTIGSYSQATTVKFGKYNSVDLGSEIFIDSVCGKTSNPTFPDRLSMVAGGTISFSFPDDMFTRVRSRQMFVRIESLDPTTKAIKIISACSWYYTGGGGGSLEFQAVGVAK